MKCSGRRLRANGLVACMVLLHSRAGPRASGSHGTLATCPVWRGRRRQELGLQRGCRPTHEHARATATIRSSWLPSRQAPKVSLAAR